MGICPEEIKNKKMAGTQILANPVIENGRLKKGAIAITIPEEILNNLPYLKEYFYIIECYGGKEILNSKFSDISDIKLIENPLLINKAKAMFPDKIILDTAIADYTDTTIFKNLNLKKEYTGIQISSWTSNKRNELFIKSANLIPNKKFIKFGHFTKPLDLNPERKLKKEMINLSKNIGKNQAL